MKGLLVKDFLNLKRYFRTVLLMVFFYVVLALTNGNISFISAMITLLFAMMAITSFSYDETAKWDKYGLSLPVTRKETVLSKYILSVLLIVMGSVLSLIGGLIYGIVKNNLSIIELMRVTYAIFCAAILYNCIIVPLIYKFGVEKLRLIMVAVFAIPFGIFAALSAVAGPIDINSYESLANLLIYISPLLLIFFLYISLQISISIYQKKEI